MNTHDLTRFWSKVDIQGEDDCWNWIASSKHPFGYGRFGYEKKKELAHRISYNLHNPPLNKGQCVLHQCDNPLCVNPKHLKAGTRKENVLERDNRNRTSKGETVPSSILTEQDVLIIKSSNKTTKELALEYSVGYNTIWAIRKGINWSHI